MWRKDAAWAMALVGLMFCARASAAAAAAEVELPTRTVHVQVIEATKKTHDIDPALMPLRSAIVGYTGARLVDEVEAKVQLKNTVSLEIQGRTKTVRVTLLEVQPDGTVKLHVSVDAFKFATNTSHKRKNSTVLVAHKTGPGTALFLAITPRP